MSNPFHEMTVQTATGKTMEQVALEYLRAHGPDGIPGHLLEPIAWLMNAAEELERLRSEARHG